MSSPAVALRVRAIVLGLLAMTTAVLVVRHLDARRARAAQTRLHRALEVKSFHQLERHVEGADNGALWLEAAATAVGRMEWRQELERVERESGCAFLEDGGELSQTLLEEHGMALAAAHFAEQATDSSFGIDYREGLRFRWPPLLTQLHLARLLHLEGRLRLCKGDLDGALTSTRTLRQLRDSLQREPLALLQVVGTSVGNRYLWLTREWLAQPEPRGEVLRELAATSPARDLVVAAARALSLEAMLAASLPPESYEDRAGLGRVLVRFFFPQGRRREILESQASRLERLREVGLDALDIPDVWFPASPLADRLRRDQAQRQLLRAAVQLRRGEEATEVNADNAFTHQPLIVDHESNPPSVRVPGALERWRATVGPEVDEASAPVLALPIGPATPSPEGEVKR